MRFWRRRSVGKHALGAAVTGIPSAVPRAVVTAVPVQVPVQVQASVPVPVPRTAVAPLAPAPAGTAAHAVPLPRTAATVDPASAHADRPAQAADRSALPAARPQPATPPTACAPVPSALERALFGHLLLQEQVSDRPSTVVAQPRRTEGAETSPPTLAFAPPPAAPALAPPTARPTPVVVPSVQLGFRDGSTVELDPGSPHARSLQTLARALTTLD